VVNRAAPLYPEGKRHHRVFRGLSERQERVFNWIAGAVVLLFVAGWVGAIVIIRGQVNESRRIQAETGVNAPDGPMVSATRKMASAIINPRTPKAPYLTGALNTLRGESGELKFATATPGSHVSESVPEVVTPVDPGVYKLRSRIATAGSGMDDFSLISLVPLAEKQAGKIGLYYLGSWPFEKGGKPLTASYAAPSGFIEVTQANQDTYVSEHFRLRDFLTKDQHNVWPKYLPLDPRMIDKLELTIQELEKSGIKVEHMQVLSGFRTPRYNEKGGNTAGRANLSRHMYGDAADIFVDNDRNSTMDDLNRDGRGDTRDADVVAQAAERVERRYPSLVGGIGVYKACCGHGPFVHVDVRGNRARWRE